MARSASVSGCAEAMSSPAGHRRQDRDYVAVVDFNRTVLHDLAAAHEQENGQLQSAVRIEQDTPETVAVARGQVSGEFLHRARLLQFDLLVGEADGVAELGHVLDGDLHGTTSPPATGSSRMMPFSSNKTRSASFFASLRLCVTCSVVTGFCCRTESSRLYISRRVSSSRALSGSSSRRMRGW